MIAMYLTLAILALTFGLLIFTRLPPVAVFVGALTLTITFHLAPLAASLKGFSNPGVLTIGALFMIAAGMYSTGAITILSDRLIGRPKSVFTAQLKILPSIAFGSAFLNNTPLVAMMIPVIRDLSRSCDLDARKLYLPLSYASILGGTCTLIGTATNLVIAGMITDAISDGGGNLPYMEPVGLFDLSLVGVPVTVAGIVFILFTSRWLLPRTPTIRIGHDKKERRYFRVELKVDPEGPLVGRTLEEAGLTTPEGFEIISVTRRESTLEFGPGTVLQPNDVIAFAADIDGAKTLWATIGLQPIYSTRKSKAERHSHHLVEVVVSNRNAFLGQRIGDLAEQEDREYEVWLVGMARDGAAMDYPLRDAIIQAGDVALLEVKDRFFYRNRNEIDFSMTKRLRGARIQRTDKAIVATLITLAMIVSVTMGWLTMLNAALLAAGAMLLTGCMDLSSAGKSVDFSTLVVIAAAMGLESAVTASGLSEVIGNGLAALGGDSPYIALAVVFLGCILMDAMVTNVASAVFMFPMAMTMAQGLGVSFMPFAITVMVGASCSFISPVSYQTNLMVYGPGEYTFGDFVKIGIPLSLLVGVITIALAPLFFPFHP
ncbi:MAG TPA: SLC13 family permease [Desulfobulbus sp.]|nr:SLC13 family permease [Desulfobulbus sp.]